MTCSKCGATMVEVSKWEMAPFGGYRCPDCGFCVSKKSHGKCMRFFNIWK